MEEDQLFPATDKENHLFFKICSVGDSSVGKSSLLLRYTDTLFDEKIGATIVVDFKIKTIQVDDTLIKLQIWDTAGQEKFRTITAGYYRNTHAIMIVFDITNKESFQNVNTIWMEETNRYSSSKSIKFLVGNKLDLSEERVIHTKEAKEYADSIGMTYFETSAKTNENVETTFMEIARAIKKQVVLIKSDVPPKDAPVVQPTLQPTKKKKKLCLL